MYNIEMAGLDDISASDPRFNTVESTLRFSWWGQSAGLYRTSTGVPDLVHTLELP